MMSYSDKRFAYAQALQCFRVSRTKKRKGTENISVRKILRICEEVREDTIRPNPVEDEFWFDFDHRFPELENKWWTGKDNKTTFNYKFFSYQQKFFALGKWLVRPKNPVVFFGGWVFVTSKSFFCFYSRTVRSKNNCIFSRKIKLLSRFSSSQH